MIRVTVELLPHGREHGKRLLGEMLISNDGSLSKSTGGKRGAYTVSLSKMVPMGETRNFPPGIWKRGKVADFDRIKRGPWDLMYLALRVIVGKRNP